MKKGCVITLAVAMIILVARHLYLSVDGSEISRLISESNIGMMQMTKTRMTSKEPEVMAQIVMSDEQIETLVKLLDDTKFRTITSQIVHFPSNYSENIYLITATTAEKNRIFFRLESHGGEFMYVDWGPGNVPAKHWKIRIQNDEWENTLEQILALGNENK